MFMKARMARPKDDGDLAEVLARLEPQRTAWLRKWVAIKHPGHRWLKLLPE
jgi:hypothetical protein